MASFIYEIHMSSLIYHCVHCTLETLFLCWTQLEFNFTPFLQGIYKTFGICLSDCTDHTQPFSFPFNPTSLSKEISRSSPCIFFPGSGHKSELVAIWIHHPLQGCLGNTTVCHVPVGWWRELPEMDVSPSPSLQQPGVNKAKLSGSSGGLTRLEKKAGRDQGFLILFKSFTLKVKKTNQTKTTPKSIKECKAQKQQNQTSAQTCTQNVPPAQSQSWI